MAFTLEQRQRAKETLKRKAAERRQMREATEPQSRAETNRFIGAEVVGTVFDWETSPINVIVARQADMKREYDRISQIVTKRLSSEPRVWKCWTQSHKHEVSKNTLAQCNGTIPEGKWMLKDDGYRNAQGQVEPIVICRSQLCYQEYMQKRPVGGLSRH